MDACTASTSRSNVWWEDGFHPRRAEGLSTRCATRLPALRQLGPPRLAIRARRREATLRHGVARLNLRFGPRQLLRDFPDVAVRIAERRGAHPPFAVYRPVEQRDAARGELRDRCVGVVDPDRELEPRADVPTRDSGGLDQLGRGPGREQVDDQIVELERGRFRVLEDDRHVEDPFVERLRPLRVVDEQRDGANAGERRIHRLPPMARDDRSDPRAPRNSSASRPAPDAHSSARRSYVVTSAESVAGKPRSRAAARASPSRASLVRSNRLSASSWLSPTAVTPRIPCRPSAVIM